MNDHDQASQPSTAATATSTVPRPKRRYLRIGLRTFLVLVTIACVWVGLEANRARQRARRQHEAVKAIIAAGGSVEYDYQFDFSNYPQTVTHNPNAEPPDPSWLQSLLGIDHVSDVVSIAFVDSEVTDLSQVARFPRLRFLRVLNASVSDLSPLANLTQLEWLKLQGTQVRDLSPLSNLTDLQELYLLDAPASDLTPLAKLSKLKRLRIEGLAVTPEDVKQLRQALPNCTVAP